MSSCTCETCVHWEPRPKDQSIGHCTINPPRIIEKWLPDNPGSTTDMDVAWATEWPITPMDCRCGEYHGDHDE